MRFFAQAALASFLMVPTGSAIGIVPRPDHHRVSNERGTLISIAPAGLTHRPDLERIAAEFPGAIVARSGARMFRIEYWTVLKGRPARASGLLVEPDSSNPPKGLVLFMHGTNATRSTAPSQPGRVDGNEEAAVFAGNGFTVALPDYLGLGTSRAKHPYLIVEPQVDATIDLLRAIKHLIASVGNQTSTKLFMMGFSQGGQVAAGVHRELDRRPLPGFQLRGSVGIAGPYNLRETSLPKAIENNCRLCVGYLAWATFAYADYYGHPLSGAIQKRYLTVVPRIFDGSHTASEIGAALPDDPAEMFRPDYLRSLRTGSPNWFTRALARNETYAWKPIAPFRIYFGDQDSDVPPSTARFFFDYARAQGGNVTLHKLAGADHQGSSALTYAPALAWFEQLAKQP